jgi:hypothetical protein
MDAIAELLLEAEVMPSSLISDACEQNLRTKARKSRLFDTSSALCPDQAKAKLQNTPDTQELSASFAPT